MADDLGSPERKERRSSETEANISPWAATLATKRRGPKVAPFLFRVGLFTVTRQGVLGQDQYTVILLPKEVGFTEKQQVMLFGLRT